MTCDTYEGGLVVCRPRNVVTTTGTPDWVVVADRAAAWLRSLTEDEQ